MGFFCKSTKLIYLVAHFGSLPLIKYAITCARNAAPQAQVAPLSDDQGAQ